MSCDKRLNQMHNKAGQILIYNNKYSCEVILTTIFIV